MEKHEQIQWICKWRLEKRAGDWSPAQIEAGDAPDPFEVIQEEGNLLMYGGVSALWQRLIGTAITAFDNTNAYLGVGNSTTAAAATQTALQGGSTLLKAMDATYPQHTDGVTSGAASIVYRATFGTSEANFAWEEWGLFNASSGGRMLNRRVASMGTKSAGATWTLTVTLTLA